MFQNMTARGSRKTWPVPLLLLILESFTPKTFPKHREGAVCSADVALTVAQISGIVCLGWSEES